VETTDYVSPLQASLWAAAARRQLVRRFLVSASTAVFLIILGLTIALRNEGSRAEAGELVHQPPAPTATAPKTIDERAYAAPAPIERGVRAAEERVRAAQRRPRAHHRPLRSNTAPLGGAALAPAVF
jgi:hypothetical protein